MDICCEAVQRRGGRQRRGGSSRRGSSSRAALKAAGASCAPSHPVITEGGACIGVHCRGCQMAHG
jgi:hypothetical protein